MGNILMTRAHPDQPSLTDPGELSVVTDLVTKDMVPDVDEFFEELIQHIMDPIEPWEPYFLKEFRVEKHEDDPAKTTVKIFRDCDKIKRIFPDFPLQEWCRLHFTTTVRPEEHYVQTEEYWPDGSMFRVNKICTKLHLEENGFRVEVWCFDHQNVRQAGPALAIAADLLYLKPLLLCRLNTKVRVRSEVDMPSSGGKSILTDAMDEFFTQPEVFDVLVRLLKQECIDRNGAIHYNSDSDFQCSYEAEIPFPKLPDASSQGPPGASDDGAAGAAGAKPVEDAGTDEAAEGTVAEESEDAKKIREALETAGKAFHETALKVAQRVELTKNNTFILKTCRRVLLDRERFQLVVSEHIMDELFNTRFFRIHTDPVRLEEWQVLPNGLRHASFKEACTVRLLMLKLTSEADVAKQAKDLDESQENFYF